MGKRGTGTLIRTSDEPARRCTRNYDGATRQASGEYRHIMSKSASSFDTPVVEDPSPAVDPRRQLVDRIVASHAFVKSLRLCEFLRFVSEMSFEGRDQEISELTIGEAVFGRSSDYDPSIDSIVRSHASRLRQRLEKYFLEEGIDEAIRLSIPKGGYVPVFAPARTALHASFLKIGNSTAADTQPEIARSTRASRVAIWILSIALATSCGVLVYLFARRPAVASAADRKLPAKHPFWNGILGSGRPATVVCSDTGLTILENLTHKEVKLADYMSGDYRALAATPIGATSEVTKVLAEHRYTSIVDLQVVSKLNQVADQHGGPLQIRYARDIRIDELKEGSTILLGTQEGNPWVGLFSDRMNFVIEHNREWGEFFVIDRSPRGAESTRYVTSQQDPFHKVYGIVALLPNLGGTGKVLILEGTSMAGTESAADFVFDDSRLLQFLDRIQSSDGDIPYFELLLQSSNVDGYASKSQIVGYRTSRE